MRILTILSLFATPAIMGSIAVMRMEGGGGFCIALFLSMLMLRETAGIAAILMQRWHWLGQEFYLVEHEGESRWVDESELEAIPVPHRIKCCVYRSAIFGDVTERR